MKKISIYLIILIIFLTRVCSWDDYKKFLKDLSSKITNIASPNVKKDDIKFLFYTTSNKTIALEFGTSNHLLSSEYPTKLIIPAWNSSGRDPPIFHMAHMYQKEENCQVILIDWSEYSQKNYLIAVGATPKIGSIIGDFILNQKKFIPKFLDNLHVIGYSLSCHIAGFAGKRVKKKSGEKIDRITGLDPAAILFEYPKPKSSEERLDKSDAKFVDIIHTQIGLGVMFPYGTVDFYVNAGLVQLGCSDELPNVINFGQCGHGSVLTYYSNTISEPKKYKAVGCKNFISFTMGRCEDNKKVYMGEWVSRKASGIFQVLIDEEGNGKSKI